MTTQFIEYVTTITSHHTSTKVNGKLHSINDQPAKVYADGSQCWYTNGKQHRDNDQPAEIWADGTQRWYINGKQHRDNDQPAVTWVDGARIWCINNDIHRDNDQPAVIWANGSQFWYINGELHRDNDQPAIIKANGSQRWYINGKEVVKSIAPIADEIISFTVNKFVVNYCNIEGVISQIVNIKGDTTSVNYELTFNGKATYKYTIDIKIKDLNNITKMRVSKDNEWSIAAMVNGNWIIGILC